MGVWHIRHVNHVCTQTMGDNYLIPISTHCLSHFLCQYLCYFTTPSFSDVRTQADYQLLDPNFIGLIFSCFNQADKVTTEDLKSYRLSHSFSPLTEGKFSKRNCDSLCCSSSNTYLVCEVCPPGVLHASVTCLCITHMKLCTGSSS